MSAKTEELMKTIEVMSVIELHELVEALKEKFNVTAAVPVAAVQAGGGAAAPAAEEKSSFTVFLVTAGEKKIPVIKAVREITGLGLKEAKDLVDAGNKAVKENVKKEEAQEFKKKLEEAGAQIELK
ncbi:MAG: 50S ribosomal protein L7/L12 [Spirochaetes bacterium GWF1_41_5]|nr:MAG: 50S ribosomal protein L7/L12 [Spirochaetes bacterium GWF1_41_5]HBE01053.1 50S ribosomal protein L7/L12 [Spirochaetia bacterium]